MNISDANLSALLSLLKDPDEAMFQEITETLTLDAAIIPTLERLWRQADNETAIVRLEWLIGRARLNMLANNLKQWMSNDGEIIKGAWLVASYQYPELTFDEIDCAVSSIEKDVWMELTYNMTPEEEIMTLNRVFFGKYGMQADKQYKMSVRNTFINNVLNTRIASHLAMTILYLGVADKACIPVYGVWLFNALRIAYVINNEIQFYIEVFPEGKIFDHDIAKLIITEQGVKFDAKYIQPCNNEVIICGLIHELRLMYERAGAKNNAEDMEFLQKNLTI